ncbi:MAG: GDP-L-fucose synthase family protein [Micavibrio sp.]
MFTLQNKKIWVAGHQGMVGQALLRKLDGPCTILTAKRSELDLRQQNDVQNWIAHHRPDAIIFAAATVGGIEANRTRPAEFLYDNLMMATNVIHAAAQSGTEKLLYLGSSCIYPRDAAQPIAESALLSGPLEPTNEFYAIAKIAGLKLCQSYRRQYGCNFIAAMPCNLYGPGDRYDALQSHVIPALILKFEEAIRMDLPILTLWGTGTPLREFLHVDDLAEALIIMLEYYSDDPPVNIGSGTEVSIKALAKIIAEIFNYRGELIFDASMPDGMPRKILDSAGIRAMGWTPDIQLRQGLEDCIARRRQSNAA